jgi:multiple sugar transport system permease protein
VSLASTVRRRPDRDGSSTSRDSVFTRSAALLILGVCAVYVLLPVWWLVVAATKNRSEFTGTNPLWFADFALVDNIRQLLAYDNGVFVRWMLNSVAYTGGAALFGTLLAAMCGYALAKYRFPGRETLFNVVLGGVLVPATALALPLFLIFSYVGATNTFWSVFLPSLVNPFGVYLAQIYASASVPDDLLEAARIDGSGEVRTFFTVAGRLMFPGLVTIFLFHFVAVWNSFLLPLIMLGDQRLFPVTLGLYTWNTQINQIPELRGLVLVGALLSVAPLIVAFLSLERFWRNGLATGALK